MLSKMTPLNRILFYVALSAIGLGLLSLWAIIWLNVDAREVAVKMFWTALSVVGAAAMVSGAGSYFSTPDPKKEEPKKEEPKKE